MRTEESTPCLPSRPGKVCFAHSVHDGMLLTTEGNACSAFTELSAPQVLNSMSQRPSPAKPGSRKATHEGLSLRLVAGLWDTNLLES
jgi:hypothetical protein